MLRGQPHFVPCHIVKCTMHEVFELHDIFYLSKEIGFQALMQNPEFKLIENVFNTMRKCIKSVTVQGAFSAPPVILLC